MEHCRGTINYETPGCFTNTELKKVFEERSIIDFKRNKNIQNTIGWHSVLNGRISKIKFNEAGEYFVLCNTPKDVMLPSSNESKSFTYQSPNK